MGGEWVVGEGEGDGEGKITGLGFEARYAACSSIFLTKFWNSWFMRARMARSRCSSSSSSGS